jgi:hypothetical protein
VHPGLFRAATGESREPRIHREHACATRDNDSCESYIAGSRIVFLTGYPYVITM